MSQKRLKKIRKLSELKVGVNLSPAFGGEPLQIIKIIKENWIFLVMITVAVVAVFANGMNAAFVSDDYATILNNPEITKWSYAFRGGASTYFINSVVAKMFGVVPLPFHLNSLFLYLITCYLAFVFIYHLFGRGVAWITLSLFAVHPIHVEAVTWISGKPYLLIAMYVLLSMIWFVKFVETENIWYLVGTFGSFVLGFLTDNPRPFSLFLIIPLYLWLAGIDIRRNKWWKYWPLTLIPMAIIAVIVWPHIMTRVGVVNAGVNASDSLFYNPFFQYPTGVAKYLQLLWVPIDLTLYHTMYVFPIWLNWAILLTYLALIGYFAWKDKRHAFALMFIFVAILPSMMPVKVSWLVAERYAYLGSLGFCLFLALILQEMSTKVKLMTGGIMVVILSLFSVRLMLRNIDWTTNHKLWVNTCQVSPNSHNAWNNIGDDYDKLKQYDDAVKGFSQSTVIKPNYADAYHNRANIFFKIGRNDLARQSYNTALYYNPSLYQTYLSLINIDLIEKDLDSALNHAKTALQVNPNDPTTHYILAVVLSQRNETQQAIDVLERLVKAYPQYRQAQEALVQLKGQPK
ncbi:tetratricopeptide repeat protein [Candidatus Shapirobacteria bacterium]|nr:tetratricopeptide repeat protein [Candidatus Shapirobacteria bacterium]